MQQTGKHVGKVDEEKIKSYLAQISEAEGKKASKITVRCLTNRCAARALLSIRGVADSAQAVRGRR